VGVLPSVGASIVAIVDRDGTNQQTNNWNSYNVEVQQALALGTSNRLTYGVNYRHNAVKGNFLTEFTSEDRLGFYAQDEWQITDRLKAQAGLRYDLDTFINPTLSPRFSLIFRPLDNHTLRAGIAVAYRPPTIFENSTDSRACVDDPGPSPPPCGPFFATTTLTGSNLLQPEQMVSYDVGYQGWYWKHRLQVRADLFLNHISDSVSQPRVGFNFIFKNGREADIYGGEAGVEVLATSWLTAFANYSFQEITQSFQDLDRRGGPKHKANAGLRGEWENGLNGEVAVHYYGAATYPLGITLLNAGLTQKVDSYVLLNMRGAYVFWKENGKDKAEIAVTAFNALNDKHREHPLGDLIGSRVMGWLTLRY
jgi:outer membrane receptor protein involved in Fe transport